MSKRPIEYPVAFYKRCLTYVIENYGLERVEYFRNLNLEDISVQDFFEEYAWVCLASGFRWRIIDEMRNDLAVAFLDWDIQKIASDPNGVFVNAMEVLNHENKIGSIVHAACLLATWSTEAFKEFKRRLSRINSADSPELINLRRFGFIGPITQYHLARNLGLNFPKPDRHLITAAGRCGYPETPQGVFDFVNRICEETGERPEVVDFVIWRYMADCT